MTPPPDPVEHALVITALTSGLSNCVEWIDVNAIKRVNSDPEMRGLVTADMARRMLLDFAKGGTIEQVRETRPDYAHRNYDYKPSFRTRLSRWDCLLSWSWKTILIRSYPLCFCSTPIRRGREMNDPSPIRPRKCPTCRHGELTRVRLENYSMTYFYEGAHHTVQIQDVCVRQCMLPACAAMMLDNETNERLDRALRDQVEILQPEVMHAQRERLVLSRRALADAIGIDEASIELYETGGQLTPRAIDRLLRKIFENPEVRKAYGLDTGAARSDIPAPTTAVA